MIPAPQFFMVYLVPDGLPGYSFSSFPDAASRDFRAIVSRQSFTGSPAAIRSSTS